MTIGNTSSSLSAMLKELYSDDRVANAIYKKNALLGMVPKDEKIEGKYFVQPIVYGAGQSRSASFSTAQSMSAKSGELMADYIVQYVENHDDATVATKLMAMSTSDKGAFLRAIKLIPDNHMQNFGNDIAVSMYRDSSGFRGRISSDTTLASSTLKLAQAADATNFEVGMQLDVAQTQSSASTRAYGSASHGLYVSAVNVTAGTLTVATTPVPGGTPCNITDSTDGVPTADHGDYLYVTGDRNAKFQGLSGWIPYGGPTGGDSFYNVDRTVMPTRLAGTYIDGTSGSSISSVIEDAIAQTNLIGGDPDYCFMPFKKFAALSKELGSKAQIVNVQSTAQVGYEGIKVAGSGSVVTCLADRSCPANSMFLVKMDTLKLRSWGQIVRLWDLDGNIWLRTPSDSGMEIRFYSLGAFTVQEPMHCCNIRVNP
jgi:hypothetical protein